MQVHSRLAICGDSHAYRLSIGWQETLPTDITGVQVRFIGRRGASLNGTSFCRDYIQDIINYHPTHVFIWIGANDLEQRLRGTRQYEYGRFNQIYDDLVHLNDVIRQRTGVNPTLFQALRRYQCRYGMRPEEYNLECFRFNSRISHAHWAFNRTFNMPADLHFRTAFQSDWVHLHDENYSQLAIELYDRFFLYD